MEGVNNIIMEGVNSGIPGTKPSQSSTQSRVTLATSSLYLNVSLIRSTVFADASTRLFKTGLITELGSNLSRGLLSAVYLVTGMINLYASLKQLMEAEKIPQKVEAVSNILSALAEIAYGAVGIAVIAGSSIMPIIPIVALSAYLGFFIIGMIANAYAREKEAQGDDYNFGQFLTDTLSSVIENVRTHKPVAFMGIVLAAGLVTVVDLIPKAFPIVDLSLRLLFYTGISLFYTLQIVNAVKEQDTSSQERILQVFILALMTSVSLLVLSQVMPQEVNSKLISIISTSVILGVNLGAITYAIKAKLTQDTAEGNGPLPIPNPETKVKED